MTDPARLIGCLDEADADKPELSEKSQKARDFLTPNQEIKGGPVP
jgi:hypothetical protein